MPKDNQQLNPNSPTNLTTDGNSTSSASSSTPSTPQKVSDQFNTITDSASKEEDLPKVTSPHAPQKYGGTKIIATIFGVVFLIVGVVAGVLLIQRQQELREEAKEKEHKIDICHVPPGNPENANVIEVDKNSWKEGHNPHNAHSLDFIIDEDDLDGDGDDDDNHAKRQCPQVTETPTASPTLPPGTTSTPTQSATATLTPTLPPQVSASCSDVITYDESWNILSDDDLKNLKSGDIVRFTVSGSSTSGSFDKARFTINGSQKPEVIGKKPSSNEFYYEYTIPNGVSSFTVKGEVHHSSLGWI